MEYIKQTIKDSLQHHYRNTYHKEVNVIVEEPKRPEMGDLALPIFTIAKALEQKFPTCAQEMIAVLEKNPMVQSATLTGGFLNITIDKASFGRDVLTEITHHKQNSGNRDFGKGKTVVLDYSAPNIAKSFSIGHLRSTMIGHALRLIHEKCGYRAIGINHLGDWGTQFGKMIVAYEKWGNESLVKANPIEELAHLYVKFHDEANSEPKLEDAARDAFLKLEEGHPRYTSLWEWFKEVSLQEFMTMYDLLGVSFDSYHGEAFYNDKMDDVVRELEQKKLLKLDQGAMIVDLGESMPPALIKRSDGGTLYMTRDIAAVLYRQKTYQFDKALYVVGNEQKLHFQQLKAVIEKMGYDFSEQIEHVNFGLVLTDGKKMSTRKGKIVKLYDVLQETVAMAKEAIEAKNPDLKDKENVAEAVGVGAVIFNDLKNHRTLDIEFNMASMLTFEGQTGPYLQYTGVRIASILRENTLDLHQVDASLFAKPHYFDIIRQLSQFGVAVEKAATEASPSIIAKYLLQLAQAFNKFYALEKIVVTDDIIRNTNLWLITSIRYVLNEGLRLLGIQALERM